MRVGASVGRGAVRVDGAHQPEVEPGGQVVAVAQALEDPQAGRLVAMHAADDQHRPGVGCGGLGAVGHGCCGAAPVHGDDRAALYRRTDDFAGGDNR